MTTKERKTMKALVLEEYNRFEYKDVKVPEIGPSEVLIEIKAAGICGSDVHGVDGSTGRRQTPLIMGHEASGVVVEKGQNVQDWDTGDRVTFDSTVYCGECFFCQRGQINLCENREVLGVSPEEYKRDGAFAEYVAVPEHILYKVPKGVSFEEAAMVEPASVAVHAVHRAGLELNDTTLVAGAGMIGSIIVQALDTSGCSEIIVVDLDENRLDTAREFGATETLKPSSDVTGLVQDRTNGLGVDVAFEAVGIEETIKMALGSLRKGGTLTAVGNLSPLVEFPLQDFVTRELDVKASCASAGEYSEVLDMIARSELNLEPLISKTAHLRDGEKWFKELQKEDNNLMKVILKP